MKCVAFALSREVILVRISKFKQFRHFVHTDMTVGATYYTNKYDYALYPNYLYSCASITYPLSAKIRRLI